MHAIKNLRDKTILLVQLHPEKQQILFLVLDLILKLFFLHTRQFQVLLTELVSHVLHLQFLFKNDFIRNSDAN